MSLLGVRERYPGCGRRRIQGNRFVGQLERLVLVVLHDRNDRLERVGVTVARVERYGPLDIRLGFVETSHQEKEPGTVDEELRIAQPFRHVLQAGDRLGQPALSVELDGFSQRRFRWSARNRSSDAVIEYRRKVQGPLDRIPGVNHDFFAGRRIFRRDGSLAAGDS